MYVMLNREQHALLLQLVESRVRELHPEIRRCATHQFRDELKAELESLQATLRRLHEAEFDVTA